MALNSYMFGTMCPNFLASQSPEVQRAHLEQLQKAQQYIQQAMVVMLSQQQNSFDNWIGSCATDTMQIGDVPSHEFLPETDVKPYHPFEHERFSNNVLDQYYNLLGKQIEHMEKQVGTNPPQAPSAPVALDETRGDNFRVKLMDHNTTSSADFFSQFPEYC